MTKGVGFVANVTTNMKRPKRQRSLKLRAKFLSKRRMAKSIVTFPANDSPQDLSFFFLGKNYGRSLSEDIKMPSDNI